MSDIKGGHKKLILNKSTSPNIEINSYSQIFLSFMVAADRDLSILNRYGGNFVKLDSNHNDKYTIVCSNNHNLYYTYGSPTSGNLNILRKYANNNPDQEETEIKSGNELPYLISVASRVGDTVESLLYTCTDSDGVYTLRVMRYDFISHSILSEIIIDSTTYNERPYWCGNCVFSISSIIHRISVYPYTISMHVGKGAAISGLSGNVIIYSKVETVDEYEHDPYYSVCRIQVKLSYNYGATFFDITDRINSDLPFDISYYEEIDGKYYIYYDSYEARQIYWTSSSNGRILCGFHIPNNYKGVTATTKTRIYLTFNYGITFEDCIIVDDHPELLMYYVPVCNNIGANGNILLGRYFDCYEESQDYPNHLQLTVYNVYTNARIDIPSLDTLINTISPSDYVQCTYELSSDGNYIIVGASVKLTTLGMYKLLYIKVNIKDLSSPSVEDYDIHPKHSLLNHWLCPMVATNF
jgi:hypothetical protein